MQLLLHKMSINTLSKVSGLTRYQVDNLIYDRARNLENLQKVAGALNVPLATIIGSTKLEQDFDPIFYAKVVQTIGTLLHAESCSVPKTIVDRMAAVVCKHKNDIGSDELEQIVRGVVWYASDGFKTKTKD